VDKKFAALGDRKELLPLKSLGFDIYDCMDFEEAKALIDKLNSEAYNLVIVTENIVEGNQAPLLDIIRGLSLTVLVLPEYKVKRNLAKEIVKKAMREAVGL
jgi:vacuolar-type H+-ATPase subunit F/Vma7